MHQERAGWRSRAEQWFEAPGRKLPGGRWLRTSLRTLHLIAVGALYGGHMYGVEAERLVPALAAVLASGGAIVLFEVWQERIWWIQVRGIATFLKLGLVASVSIAWDLRIVLLTLALVIGSVSSHMPGRWRYLSLLHGRVVGSTEKG
ncbi:MAG: hypothetical protein GY723_19600 [bacterium]|nr:hypothetical protein [bacterium]MCP5067733.1 hypothetical protein [bacterium]